MRKTSTQALSPEAQQQLTMLRGRGESFGSLAAKIPCSSATIWKAAAGEALARPTRWLIELRLKELTAGEGAQLEAVAV